MPTPLRWNMTLRLGLAQDVEPGGERRGVRRQGGGQVAGELAQLRAGFAAGHHFAPRFYDADADGYAKRLGDDLYFIDKLLDEYLESGNRSVLIECREYALFSAYEDFNLAPASAPDASSAGVGRRC